MGNFQIPNLAMSAKNLQKTVEPNHEGNGQKWPLVRSCPQWTVLSPVPVRPFLATTG